MTRRVEILIDSFSLLKTIKLGLYILLVQFFADLHVSARLPALRDVHIGTIQGRDGRTPEQPQRAIQVGA
jgi:hypothetical protein